MNFSSKIFLNDINHGYRAAILNKYILWLLQFYMAVATYFCYQKVGKTMCTAIVSYVLNIPQFIFPIYFRHWVAFCTCFVSWNILSKIVLS